MSSEDDNIINDISTMGDIQEKDRSFDDKKFCRFYIYHLLSNRGGALTAELIALTGITYMATCSYQKDVGDSSQQSVRNCMNKFVKALTSKASDKHKH